MRQTTRDAGGACRWAWGEGARAPRGPRVARWARAVHRAIRARQARGALEADRLVRAGKEVGTGLHAIQVRIEDGRNRHHHAELRRSRGYVRHTTTSRFMRASAFAQRRTFCVVANEHATARAHIQTVRVRAADGWLQGACCGLYALEDRNGLGRCLCRLRQLLLESSDGHRPDEVSGQREVHECDASRVRRRKPSFLFGYLHPKKEFLQ